jgi:ABC-type phosphate transport system permease subunit
VDASATTAHGDRSVLERSPLHRLPDQVLQWGLSALAAGVLILIAYFFIRLIGQSTTAFSHVGFLNFFVRNNWDVSQLQQGAACTTAGNAGCTFGAWALILGTLITSAIALVIGVPVAIATALFLTELCPRRLRTPLAVLVDLLAAVPSVVYGLWGVFVLIPREVISTVPPENKEAALALGATRWEMIKIAVIPYARPGITGGAMLGLGRAIGETIAVVLVIGNSPKLGSQIFSQGYTLAAVIANEFGEAASTPVYRSALFAAGLVLFVLTLLVNILARRYVVRATTGKRTAADVVAPEAATGAAPA